jgi:toxin ParE1/3/4
VKVVWTDRAQQRVGEIHAYLAKNSPKVADEVRQHLVLSSRRLASLQNSGRQVEEYDHPDVRQLLVRPYRIIYRIRADRDRVDVLVVRHYRELLPSDLAKL